MIGQANLGKLERFMRRRSPEQIVSVAMLDVVSYWHARTDDDLEALLRERVEIDERLRAILRDDEEYLELDLSQSLLYLDGSTMSAHARVNEAVRTLAAQRGRQVIRFAAVEGRAGGDPQELTGLAEEACVKLRPEWLSLAEGWGRRLFESQREPAGWAAGVLAAAQASDPGLREVEAVIAIAADPRRRHAAHDAFNAVRRRLLREHPQQGYLGPHDHMLLFAELVAKVAYNATDPPDPFDADSGWYIAPSAVDLALGSDDPDFRERVRTALGDWPDERVLRGR